MPPARLAASWRMRRVGEIRAMTMRGDESHDSGSGAEVGRLVGRAALARGALSAFYVEVATWKEVGEFEGRLRSVLIGLVEAVRGADFDSDELSIPSLPGWVADMWGDAAVRYSLHRGEEEWSLQDLFFAFEPGRRSWEWWDVTRVAGNVLQVWVDSGGELVFNCEELRWILYLCGARTIVGPLLANSSEWEAQPSVGIAAEA